MQTQIIGEGPESTEELKTECSTCEGTGKIYMSCCGDNMYEYGEHADADICPSCKEHLGGEEDCDECDGTGKI